MERIEDRVKPVRDKILGEMIDKFGLGKTPGGVITPPETDDAMSFKPRPRWFRVTHVGPEQDGVREGQFALVAHGRWSRGLGEKGERSRFHLVDGDGILGVMDERPEVAGEEG